ncbi:30S ribosomal protein S15 [Candidatus Nomurabacteria bacterium CG_4_10_14_0_2_um_filter_30_12]|uniref:Small ribosomal subunit protein uS15 n=3 Tax=Candidatus Nomuraibacteriota TaxID=1752729 RepID=A0A1J4V6A2_9BACT|nr:MAG: 30S ribosomal protein S15 [Candidatus Nomurabacteria bacterium CG1_02_31_12]PIR68942.1 MAG: 30S ribosomal protein S15 [Candidatus Nomurabacteria bacterium CG10_big_fil_rev_8_21_14_0_10_03_31_7]PIZ87426.1 MAG: 30S ribosomal protein S15 [Candidatus Nomurabacteria bacterium CG_4_10_14_0_2_um_filter_30_12]
MLTTKKKQTVIKKNQVHEKDTGSSVVQVAILSTQIEELAKHLKKHKKDNNSRRGLIKMVADRRIHLKYLERKNKTQYNVVVKKMNLA